MDSALRARSKGVGASKLPIIRCRAGRTKARKVTITATGLPGKPNSTEEPMRPTAIGRPGRMAIFQNATSPSFFILALV